MGAILEVKVLFELRDVYEFGPGLKGAKNLWEGATRANALFLSVAVQLNSEALRPVFDWFANRLVIFNEQSPLSPQLAPVVVIHPLGKPAGGFTQVENRAFREMAIGAGASEVTVWNGRNLTDQEVLSKRFPSGEGHWE